MNTAAFDTLAAARTLREAGFENCRAEAVVGADIYCALWVRSAGIVVVMTAVMAAFELFR